MERYYENRDENPVSINAGNCCTISPGRIMLHGLRWVSSCERDVSETEKVMRTTKKKEWVRNESTVLLGTEVWMCIEGNPRKKLPNNVVILYHTNYHNVRCQCLDQCCYSA